MRFNQLLIIALFLLSGLQLSAQTTGKISGQLKNETGKAVNGATISVYNAVDKKLVKVAVADMNGNYEVEQLKGGSYYTVISANGMATTTSETFTLKEGESISSPAIALKTNSKKLDDVTVNASYKKPMIEVTADKTVFNVESSINATGSNAFELLQKSPGVVTDKDDNITMKGKNGIRIYIDGRPTQMQASDLAAYLKSINSVDIETIELITNPSAKYEAEGNAGIINFKFKKNKKVGFNGSVSGGVSAAKNPKTNSALSLNFRNKNFNLFSNYSNNYSINEMNMRLIRVQNDTLYDQKNKMVNSGWVNNLKAGADWFVSKRSTIGFIATTNFNSTTFTTKSDAPIAAMINGKLIKTLHANNTLPSDTRNINYNLNYRYADSIGRELNFDADYGMFKSKKTSFQPNGYYSPVPEILLTRHDTRNNTPSNIKIYTAKLDYETNLFKGKFGTGVKFSQVNSDNQFDFYNVLNGYDYINLGGSSNFIYKENINAGYVNYNRALGRKINIQAGVRVENTNSRGILTRADGLYQENTNVKRNYTNLFPSAAFTFNASSNHSFNLNYSRRIDRPNYQDLNPFENKLNELSYQKGNPFLRPAYTNNYQLTHTFKYRYITSISYSKVTDFIAQLLDTTASNQSYINKKNISQDLFNINFSLPFQITKWWSLYANINIFNSKYKALLASGERINLEVNSGSIFGQNTFTLGDGFTGELSGFYNAPSVWAGTFKSIAMGGMDVGIQKKIFKDKGNVKISYTDFLGTMRWKGESSYSGAKTIASGNWESQQFRINLTYRFGSSQIKQARQRVIGSEEESKRAKDSNGGFGN